MRIPHSSVLAIALAACGASGQDGPGFDARAYDVGHRAAAVAAGDADGDGRVDLLVAGDGRVTALLGDGGGGFRVAGSVAAGENAVGLATGDFDGDGRLDAVVANHETAYATLLFGGGAGFDPARTRRHPIDVDPHPHHVTVADVDGDGALDWLVDDRGRERLLVFLGDGRGGFEPGAPVAVGGDPYRGFVLADVDGDGALDVVTPNPRTVAVQWGDGEGGFEPGPTLRAPGLTPFTVAVADLDGDGRPDIAAGGGEGEGSVAIWRAGPGRSFGEPGPVVSVPEGPSKLVAADLTGDGVADLLVTGYVGEGLAVIEGGGEPAAVRVTTPDPPWGLATGDFDGDGRADLATADDRGTRVTVLLSRP